MEIICSQAQKKQKFENQFEFIFATHKDIDWRDRIFPGFIKIHSTKILLFKKLTLLK